MNDLFNQLIGMIVQESAKLAVQHLQGSGAVQQGGNTGFGGQQSVQGQQGGAAFGNPQGQQGGFGGQPAQAQQGGFGGQQAAQGGMFGGQQAAQTQQAQVTPEMIQALIVPLVQNERVKAVLTQQMQEMGIQNLPDARNDQLPELYQRFQNVKQQAEAAGLLGGQQGGGTPSLI